MGLPNFIGMGGGVGRVKMPKESAMGGRYQNLLTSGYEASLPGMLKSTAEYQPKFAGVAMDTAQQYAPGVMGLIDDADPEQAQLLGDLTRSADEGLAMGRKFDPRFLTDYRAAQASRGMGYGPGDSIRETIAAGNEGERLLAQRQGAAGQAAGINYGARIQPFIQMLTQLVGDAGSKLVTPDKALELLKMIYQGKLGANTQTASNQTALLAGGSSNMASVAGSAMSAFGGGA